MRKIDVFDSTTCTAIGLATNVLLTVLKLLAGIFGASYAMIGDAIHSASDTFATGMAYIGLRLAGKPADQSHPYGHANAETIAAFLVALVVLGTGVFVGVSAVHLVAHRHFETPGTIALAAAVASIATKEVMFRYTLKVGEKNNSPAVVATAWDHRSDAYSSVAALVGILGARLAFPYLDPVAGIVVGAIIVAVSVKLIRHNLGILMDESPGLAFVARVRDLACGVRGVRGVDDVKVHRRGTVWTVDIKILVDGRLTVEEGHELAGLVRVELLSGVEHVKQVMVHVNPYLPEPVVNGAVDQKQCLDQKQ